MLHTDDRIDYKQLASQLLMKRDNKMLDGLQSNLVEFIDFDHSLPDHRLRAAVIHRAVWDYLRPTEATHEDTQRDQEKWRLNALEWLMSDDDATVEKSFRWYLEGLTDKPDQLHKKILARCGLLH